MASGVERFFASATASAAAAAAAVDAGLTLIRPPSSTAPMHSPLSYKEVSVLPTIYLLFFTDCPWSGAVNAIRRYSLFVHSFLPQ